MLVPMSWDEHLTMGMYSGPCLQTLLKDEHQADARRRHAAHVFVCLSIILLSSREGSTSTWKLPSAPTARESRNYPGTNR